MRKGKSTSKHADDLSSRAEKQLKRKKTKSIQSMDEEKQAKLIHALNERVKELNCLYSLSKLIEKPGITLEGIFEGLVNLIPPAWQYPEITCARIILENREFKTDNFKDTKWKQSADLMVYGEKVGCVEVCYMEEKPESYEGPFIKEERDLLEAVTERLGRIVERRKAEKALKNSEQKYRTLLENMNDGFCMIDINGVLTLVNDKLCRMWKYSKESLLGRSVMDLLDEDNRAIMEEQLAQRAKGVSNPFEITWTAIDGTKVATIVSPRAIYDQGGGFAGSFAVFTDITERKRMEEKLKKLATKDVLTGFYNRRKFKEIIRIEIERVKRYNQPLSMIMFDIDHFKKVNDRYGHDSGDYVLKTIADIVRTKIRKIDYLFRWGGEEFLILSSETQLNNAHGLAERIRKAVESYQFKNIGKVTISFGLTEFKGRDTEDSFIKRADDAMYKAKKKGRNRVEVSV